MRLAAAIAVLLASLAGPALGGEPPWPWADALAADLQDAQAPRLSPAQMEQLDAALTQYRAPSGIRLNLAALDGILAESALPPAEPESWLVRVWNWLLDRIREGFAPDWLQIGQSLPQTAFEWVFGLCMTAIILLALFLAANEIRHGHWRRWRREARPAGSAAARPEAAQLSWEQAAGLPPGERPGAALRIVLAALALRGLLHARAGATHRALAANAASLAPKLRAPLRQLAALAERARYGGWQPQAQDGDQALALGRAIVGGEQP